ncbi:hypothetical protein DYH09_34340 [bacterium CPR1]|nr:hypothetical protein [bacterium CPR1]
MTKQELQEFVSRLPEGDYSPTELQDRLSLHLDVQEALQQVEKGQVYTQEEIEQDLDRWLAE